MRPEDILMFLLGVVCALYIGFTLVLVFRKTSTVVKKVPEHGYEVHATRDRGWVHVTDEEKYNKFLKQKQDEFLDALMDSDFGDPT